MSPIDHAIRKAQRRYHTARHGLHDLLFACGNDHVIYRFRETLEEFGIGETSRQLRTAPELLGLERQSDKKLIAKLESACRTFVEASDALDWAIVDSPQHHGPDGWLMAFDGELARVTSDGEIRYIDAPKRDRDQDALEQQRDQDNEDWDQDREF